MPLAAPSRLPPPADLTTLPDATDGDEAIVDPEVIDLTCDERLISERGEYTPRQPLHRSSFKKPPRKLSSPVFDFLSASPSFADPAPLSPFVRTRPDPRHRRGRGRGGGRVSVLRRRRATPQREADRASAVRHQWPTLQVSVPSQTSLIFPPVPHGSHTRSAILPRASPVPIALASRETIASRRRAIPRRHARQRTRPRSHSNFSVASHSRTSSDLPAQSHRFFLRSIGMRQDLVDWMSQQHSTLELVDETLHLAIRYLDTFLNRRGAHRPRPPRANRPTPSSKYPLKPENQCA